MKNKRNYSTFFAASDNLPKSFLRRNVKLALGQLLSLLFFNRYQRIKRGELPDQPGMIAFWVNYCQKNNRLADLAPLHRWVWESGQANQHHVNTLERFERWWQDGHGKIVAALEDQRLVFPNQFDSLFEIGCGTGEGLQRLQEGLPGLSRIVGLDLSSKVIEANRQNPDYPDFFEFVSGDALRWLPDNVGSGSIIVTIGGVFEYFPDNDLLSLFRHFSSLNCPIMVGLIEPIAADYDLETERESRSYNHENSYGHNYIRLLSESGFTIQWQHEVINEERWLMLVATTGLERASS